MRAGAVLLAAGRGARLGGAIPKALTPLGGEPLLLHALRAAEGCPELQAVVLVAPADHGEKLRRLAAGSGKVATVVEGAETRQGSVQRGLAALPGELAVVVCHDVARPFATPALYARVLEALADADGAVPVVRVSDTVKRLRDGRVAETLPRDELALAQTPQAFRRAALEEAHRLAERDGFVGTDDAVLLERAGFEVAAVPGDPLNMKITEPGDLERAAAILDRG